MSKWIVDIHGEIEGDYELIKKYEEPKTGHWTLTQRDKCIDISCSECGTTRFKDYACGYTIDELNLKKINDLIAKIRMNYCECCGAKMIKSQESEESE